MGTTALLVTGGAGFIGTNFVQHLLDETEHDVVVLDKLTYASNPIALTTVLRHPRVRLVEKDIADDGAVAELFVTFKPVGVVNLAAETHVDRSIDGPLTFVQSNVVGTLVLLDTARRYVSSTGDTSFRFLHVSTDEVFGALGPTGSFSETTRYSPNSPYAASKAGADHLVRAYFHTYKLPVLLTNCSNNYGPFQHPEKLIPLMILNALEGRPLPIYGDGRQVRDWLHVEDHCSALLTVLRRGRPGESYNVGASNEQANIEIVDLLCEVLERVQPARTNPALIAKGLSTYRELRQFVADRPGHDRRYAVDATKLRDELGWIPRKAFAQGLTQTVQWYVDHLDALGIDAIGYGRQRLGLGQAKG